jgi:hypothetical protein
MSKQVMIEIELEGGTKLSHCTGLLIHQEFGTPHSFEISLPYEIIEESKEIFYDSRESYGKDHKNNDQAL